MVSAITFNFFLRAWKRARLDSGAAALGYPRENILSKAGKGSRGQYAPGEDELTDAEIMQNIVNKMPEEMRTSFEAYHLAQIRQERCTNEPHEARANILGIPKSTYFHRVKAGQKFVENWLDDIFDRADQTAVESHMVHSNH